MGRTEEEAWEVVVSTRGVEVGPARVEGFVDIRAEDMSLVRGVSHSLVERANADAQHDRVQTCSYMSTP